MALQEEDIDLLAKCYKSMKRFMQVFLPHYCRIDYSPIFDPLFSMLDDRKSQKNVLTAPRGLGKSSIVTTGKSLRDIVFAESYYIEIIGASEKLAVEQTENIKLEIEQNEKLKAYFPLIKTKEWSKESWVIDNGGERIKVAPSGSEQSLRGKRQGEHRPDLIIVDDLENDDNIRNELQRERVRRWLFGAVLNSVDRWEGSHWRMFVIDTIKHEDSVANRLRKDPSWNSVSLELFNPDTLQSNWEEAMPTARIMQDAEFHKRQGTFDIFLMENTNRATNRETQQFHRGLFQYYDLGEEELSRKHLTTVILIDPAKSHAKGCCKTAIAGISIDPMQSRLYVRDIIKDVLRPDQIYQQALEMGKRLKANYIAPEVTSLNEFITQPLQDYMFNCGNLLTMIELKPRDSKETRAAGLLPYYRQGLVYHNKMACASLENHLIDYPSPSEWDEIDSVSSVIQFMERINSRLVGMRENTLPEMWRESITSLEELKRQCLPSRLSQNLSYAQRYN